MPINVDIKNNLTPDEQEVFSTLLKVVQTKTPSSTIRAAGGWVRDKLLGIPSDDIDIMIDNMSGEDFAKMVTQELNAKGPNVIRKNPEKSKHIETAKAYIPLSSGTTQEIDFARARQEVYTDDSRIPNIKPATAPEDAMRRDLTINSLFYNINTKEIEDFTGNGIKDLITNTIRTPEDPVKTFSDDPLRIFRTIRFAAKYNGTIAKETYQAMTNPALRDAINQKVSKERIGVEIGKMLKNPNPERALEILKESGLWDDILSESLKGTQYEGKMAPMDMEQNNPWHKLSLWGHTFQVIKNILDKYADAEPEKKVIMLLAALTHDLGKLYSEVQAESKTHPGNTSYHGHEKESQEITSHVLKYLKMEPYIDQVAGLARYHMRPHEKIKDTNLRSLRRFIRQMGEASLNWVDVLNLAIADAHAKDIEIDPSITKQYQALEAQLQEALASLKMQEQQTDIKPILNGYEIMQSLNIKPGAWMSEMSEFVKELRDEDPDISKEEAIQKLQEKYNNFDPQSWEKTASTDKQDGPKSICPRHLLKQKMQDISKLKKEKRYYEIFTTLRTLIKEYENAEDIIRLVAINILYLLLIDPKFRDNNMLTILFEKAESNFFDSVLCSFVVGILILEETATKESIIKEIGNRMVKMNPGILRTVLDMIQKEKRVFHPKIRKDLMEKLNGKNS